MSRLPYAPRGLQTMSLLLLGLCALAAAAESGGKDGGRGKDGGKGAAALLRDCLQADMSTLVKPESRNSTAWTAYMAAGALHNFQGAYDETQQPIAIVYPDSAEEVQAAVVCANAAGVPFAVRCGGHSFESMSLVPEGVIIDLASLVSLELVDKEPLPDAKKDVPAQVLVAGAGLRWGAVYEFALRHGLMAAGGTCPAVGISGYLHGGGQGHSTRAQGLASDHVEGVTVVTAEGDIVHANATVNSDLFWAVRGGGASFGIVTEWIIRPFVPPLGPVTVVEVNANCTAENIEWLLTEFYKWQPWDSLSRTWASIDFRVDGQVCGVHAVYWGSEEDAKKELKDVSFVMEAPEAIDAEVKYTVDTYEDHIRLWTLYSSGRPADTPWTMEDAFVHGTPFQSDPNTGTSRFRPWAGMDEIQAFRGAGYMLEEPIGADAIPAVAAHIAEHVWDLKAMGNGFSIYATTYGGAISDLPNSATGYGHRQHIQNFAVSVTPLRAADNGTADGEWLSELGRLLLPYSKGALWYNYMQCGSDLPEEYGSDSRWGAFFGENSGRLQDIKKQYDPEGRINGLQCWKDLEA